MRKRILAIVNPVSGRRDMLPTVDAVAHRLRRMGSCMEILVSRQPGHAASLAGNLPDAVEAILIVGGDGTVCEVVNGLNGRLTPLAILAAGTENLLARTVDMPSDAESLADRLYRGLPVKFDAGLANGRRFLAVAGIGFDAECVSRVSLNRRGHIIHLDYFWPIWRTFWGHRFPFLTVEADDRVLFEGRGFALVGNIAKYGAGLNILRKARFDDAWLDVCVFACDGRLTLLGHAACVLSRRHITDARVCYVQCSHATIRSPEDTLMQIDGDPGGTLPARFSIEPAAVRFLGES